MLLSFIDRFKRKVSLTVSDQSKTEQNSRAILKQFCVQCLIFQIIWQQKPSYRLQNAVFDTVSIQTAWSLNRIVE